MTVHGDPPGQLDDLPLLGEVLAVELANTRYQNDREDLDFLSDVDAFATWFRHAPDAARVPLPPRISPESASAIRRVRDATRQLLADAADGVRSPSSADAAETLHREARSAPAHLALDLGGSAPTWHLHHAGAADDVFVATVASQCILFLGGDDAGRVRRCARPSCPMFFVQRHRARRFCHEFCAHSVRQARYYRSVRGQRHSQAGPGPANQHDGGSARGRERRSPARPRERDDSTT